MNLRSRLTAAKTRAATRQHCKFRIIRTDAAETDNITGIRKQDAVKLAFQSYGECVYSKLTPNQQGIKLI